MPFELFTITDTVSFDIDNGILPEDDENLHYTDETAPKTKFVLGGFKKNFRSKYEFCHPSQ